VHFLPFFDRFLGGFLPGVLLTEGERLPCWVFLPIEVWVGAKCVDCAEGGTRC
jgi:hypothetical protein